MLKSRTRSKELSRVLPESELNTRVARLVVLFEDLRIETNAIIAKSIKRLDYIDDAYRRTYFLRRSIATLLEFKGALTRLDQLPDFREIKNTFNAEDKKQWEAAINFFNNDIDPIKFARNDIGGHFQEEAARYAVNNPGSVQAKISIVLGQSKKGAGPINKAVREMLERQPRKSGYVFPSPRTGERLVDIKHKFDEVRTAAKISDFRFHDLRHTAATRLADAGVNVVVIAEILGHSDIRTTKRYSHAMEEAKREAVEKLAESKPARQKRAKNQGKAKRQAAQPTVS